MAGISNPFHRCTCSSRNLEIRNKTKEAVIGYKITTFLELDVFFVRPSQKKIEFSVYLLITSLIHAFASQQNMVVYLTFYELSPGTGNSANVCRSITNRYQRFMFATASDYDIPPYRVVIFEYLCTVINQKNDG